MIFKVLVAAVALAASASAAGLCSNPEITTSGFSTTSGELFTETLISGKFSVKCNGKAVTGLTLTSTVEGNTVPVAVAGDEYQVSYFDDHAATGKGSYYFYVGEVGSDASPFSVYVHHGGVGSNPLPFGTEFIALIVAGYVVYIASNLP